MKASFTRVGFSYKLEGEMKSYFRVAPFIHVLRVSYIRSVVPCLTRKLHYFCANLRSLKVSLYYVI